MQASELATFIQDEEQAKVTPASMRMGTIISVVEQGRVTITLGGDDPVNAVPARHLGSYSPDVGDTVLVLVQDVDLLVLGSIIKGQDIEGGGAELDPEAFTEMPDGKWTLSQDYIQAHHIKDQMLGDLKLQLAALRDDVLAQNVIKETHIEDGSITTPKMTANSIHGDRITGRTMAAEKLVAGSITSEEINVAQLVASQAFINNLEVQNGHIVNLSASKLTGGTIGAHVIKLLNGTTSRIESDNYSSTNGWRIRGDGNAWFNQVTIRGKFIFAGGKGEIDDDGMKLPGYGSFGTPDYQAKQSSIMWTPENNPNTYKGFIRGLDAGEIMHMRAWMSLYVGLWGEQPAGKTGGFLLFWRNSAGNTILDYNVDEVNITNAPVNMNRTLTFSQHLGDGQSLMDFNVHRNFQIVRRGASDGSANLSIESMVGSNAWQFAHAGSPIIEFETGGRTRVYGNLQVDGSLTGVTAGMVGAVPTGRTLTAGAGLTGGGNLSADRSFSVDSTVLRTTGAQSKSSELNLNSGSYRDQLKISRGSTGTYEFTPSSMVLGANSSGLRLVSDGSHTHSFGTNGDYAQSGTELFIGGGGMSLRTGASGGSSFATIDVDGDPWGMVWYKSTERLRTPWTRSNSAAVGGNVHVNSSGYLYYGTSSLRYKDDIRNMELEEAYRTLQCRPIRFKGTGKVDIPGHTHYGYGAEEVAEIDPRLVTFAMKLDDEGEETGEVDYDTVEMVQYDRFIPHHGLILAYHEERIRELEKQLQIANEKARGMAIRPTHPNHA